MSSLVDNDVYCAVYHSNDPINNFRIRVKLERLTSNALIPSLQRLKIEEDLSRLLSQDAKQPEKSKASKTDTAQALKETERSEYEEVIIGWQHKLFSRFEFESYGKGIGPESTALEQKYYDDIQKMKANRKQPGRVFTYIEGDPHCFPKDLDYFMTDSPNEEPSQLALGLNNIRKRRAVQPRFKLSDEEYLPKTNIINRKPTPDDLRTNHLAALPHQTMYIMADLSDNIDTGAAQLIHIPQRPNEHILCMIHVYSNGTIVLEPDFNEGKMAYIVETGNLNNDVYHYYLEHASIAINLEDLIKERKLFNEVCLRQQTHRAQLIGNDFDTVPPAVLKVNVFGEIVSGKNFEYDDLYVYYSLDLPENWYAESSQIFSGYTHTASSTKSSKYDDIVYYSHPFEFELWYKPSPVSADHELPRMPKIYFQVASQDIWGRYRTEGYAYLDIPSVPGFYNQELSCWRPRGDSIFNELRRFFIGGSNELEDISYVAIPKQFESEKNNHPLSRFGFRTVTTGILNIHLNVVFQSQTIAMEHAKQRGNYAVHRYGFDAFMSNINAVIDAFQQAKKRALEVRESTLQLLTPKVTEYE
jgi:Meckel syndrome type 1 protein